ncbi:MAG: ATP-binding protein [Planctomycetia bacterium]|nr:ATP-binding protein [Planctomycetia bacterium]
MAHNTPHCSEGEGRRKGRHPSAGPAKGGSRNNFPPGKWHRLEVPSDFAAIRKVEGAIMAELTAHNYDPDCLFAVKLALEEAVVNAIRHGNRMDPSLPVCVNYDVSPERVTIRLSHCGLGFEPDNVPDPRDDENIRRPAGRGLMLMQAYMDKVVFSPRGNEITLIKYNVASPRARPSNQEEHHGNSNSSAG